jgi:hypothetical protein
MFLMTLLIALPLSLAIRDTLATHLGASAVAEKLADGADYDWWEEFMAQASGLGSTFTPSIVGFAAVLENNGRLLDNQPLTVAIVGATGAWLVVWSFLSGGVIDRYARQRATRAHGFFAACGTHFWRFLRLGAVAAGIYVILFGPIHDWIFDDAYARLTRDLTSERAGFAVRLIAYGVFSALLAVFALLFDYARVRIVVEDRRSALGALVMTARFFTRRWSRVARLFLLNMTAFVALIAAYGLLAPANVGAGMYLVLVLAVGEAYIIGRHYLKLLGYASEIALFQGELAHAAYAAAPSLVWPDSPAVETMTNAEPRGVH